MINWDGYTFTNKQVNDWMANVRELVELVKSGGGGGGSVTAAALLALIENTASVTAALSSNGQKVAFTAVPGPGSLPALPGNDNKTYNLTVLNGRVEWTEVL